MVENCVLWRYGCRVSLICRGADGLEHGRRGASNIFKRVGHGICTAHCVAHVQLALERGIHTRNGETQVVGLSGVPLIIACSANPGVRHGVKVEHI